MNIDEIKPRSFNPQVDPTDLVRFANPEIVQEVLASKPPGFIESVDKIQQSMNTGFVQASQLPKLLWGDKYSEPKPPKDATDAAFRGIGAAAEMGLELFGISKLLVTSGAMPLGKALFPRLARPAVEFGAQEATKQVRLGAAEAIHGVDAGYKGAEAVADSMALGFLIGLGGVVATGGAKGAVRVWNKLTGAEQRAALRTLGLGRDASIQDVLSAYEDQRFLYDPVLWQGRAGAAAMTSRPGAAEAAKYSMEMAKKTADKFSQIIDARDFLIGGSIKQLILSSSAKAAVAKSGITPSMVSKLGRAEWAKWYLETISQETGVPALATNPSLNVMTRNTVVSMIKSQEKSSRELVDLALQGGNLASVNRINPWLSFRHMMDSFEQKTGVPVSHLTRRMMKNTAATDRSVEKEFYDAIKVSEVASISAKDNADIASYLWSSETRAGVESKMTPEALSVAKRIEGMLQGSAAKDIQEQVFYRWEEQGKVPANIRRIAAREAIKLDTTGKVASLPGIENVTYKLARRKLGKKELGEYISSLGDDDKATALAFFASPETQSTLKNYAKDTLNAGKAAHAAGKLKKWIATQPPWGIRQRYYMSDLDKFDLIDEGMSKMGLSALNAPRAGEGIGGTLVHESLSRKSPQAHMKSGSVIKNVFSHMQRVRAANAIHDDAKIIGERFNSVGITDEDRRVMQLVLDNVLHRSSIVDPPFKIAAKAKGWFWKTRLSLLMRPAKVASMTVRDIFQSAAYGPFATTLKTMNRMPLSAMRYVMSAVTKGKSLEEVDPEMAKRFGTVFQEYVSQKRSKYLEHLMIESARIASDYKGIPGLKKASTLLERTGGLYPLSDELQRSTLWIAQYSATKKAATDLAAGKITMDKFMKTAGGRTMSPQQRLELINIFKVGNVDDVAEYVATSVTDDVLFRYRVAEKAGVEQTVDERVLMGLYQFPRGTSELVYTRGIKPMVQGWESGDMKQAFEGMMNLVKGTISSGAVKGLSKALWGMRTYGIVSEVLGGYQLLDPGTGTLMNVLDYTNEQWSQYNTGKINKAQLADRVFEAWWKPFEIHCLPFVVEIENAYESAHDVAGVNIYRSVRNRIAKLTGLDERKYKKVERSLKEKTVHAILGHYEYPAKKEKRSGWER